MELALQPIPSPLLKAIEGAQKSAQRNPADIKPITEWFTLIDHIGKAMTPDTAYHLLPAFRSHADYALRCTEAVNTLEDIYELLRRSYLFDAHDNLDSYCIALEWKRPAKNKFYLPRRNILAPLTKDLEDLENRVIRFLGISLPARVGKSTLVVFFLSWIMGKRPNESSALGGHTDSLVGTFYEEVLSLIGDRFTYAFHDIFPEARLVRTSAKNRKIDLLDKKRYPTLTCRSLEGGWTGEIEASENGYLVMDDIVKNFEEAINPDLLDKKYNTYLNITKDRKKDGARELMIGTRWNVFDPLGRVEEQYQGNPEYRFRKIPALNDANESNFNYDHGVGFSTEYYLDMKASLGDADWMAKYMQTPYVREGLVFPPDSLRFYNGITPGDAHTPPRPPDSVVTFVDVAWGGGDSLSMPIAYIYDGEAFIVDWLFHRGTKEITRPLVVGMVKKHGIQGVLFEANNGGDEYADKVSELLKAEGVKVYVSSRKAPSNASKVSRIIQWSDDIKRFHFLTDKLQSEMYRRAMRELSLFVMIGKNRHDDSPDSLAGLAECISNGVIPKIEIMKRLF